MKENVLSENQTIIMLTDGEFSDKKLKWKDLSEDLKKSKVKVHTIAIKAE